MLFQTNEEIFRHNICNIELQPNICDVNYFFLRVTNYLFLQ